MDERLLAAVHNNARWCDLVCCSHGLATVTSEEAWLAPEGSPRFYPDAVTLTPGVEAERILEGIDDRPGCSVKDSFADLDLQEHGFIVLFEAEWLFCAPDADRVARAAWSRVTTGEELDAWAAAASLEGVLGAGLLADESVRVMVARDAQRVTAGVILNRTRSEVGVSNVFTVDGRAGDVWADLPGIVVEAVGAHPMVGYERDEALSLALANGFVATGPLRVWLKPPP